MEPEIEGEISELLGATPSPLAFRALVSILDTSSEVDDDVLAWCDEALSAWPDETRQAPRSWLCALCEGFVKPTWRLVRTMQLPRVDERSDFDLEALAATGSLGAMT